MRALHFLLANVHMVRFFHLVKKIFLKSAPESVNKCRKAFELMLEVKHLLKCFLESEPYVLSPEIQIVILHLQELVLQVEVAMMSKKKLIVLQISHMCYRNKERRQGSFGPPTAILGDLT